MINYLCSCEGQDTKLWINYGEVLAAESRDAPVEHYVPLYFTLELGWSSATSSLIHSGGQSYRYKVTSLRN
jgi:hypothetical protein